MFEKIAASIGKELNFSEENIDIIRYGLESAASTLLSFIFTFVFSWILGVWQIMLIIVGASALMKNFAGGAHAKTMLSCALFSSLIFTSLAKIVDSARSFIEPNLVYVILAAIVFSFFTHYRWSPAKTPQHPLSPEYSQKLRKYSFVALGLLWLIILGASFQPVSPWQYPLAGGATVGIIWHSFTITPWGFKFTDKIDALLSLKLNKKN